MKRLLSLLLAPVLCLALTVPASALTSYQQWQEILEIDKYITEYYLDSTGVSRVPANLTSVDFLADPNLFEEYLKHLIYPLDQFSGFYWADTYDLMYPKGVSLVGIGVIVDDSMERGIYIDDVLEGGAAKEAGLAAGDQIVSIDGTDVRAMTLEEATPLLRGTSLTDVVVGVRHPGALSDVSYTLIRRNITVPNVSGALIDETTGYIGISMFGSMADAYDFEDIYLQLGELGVTDLIVDLRNNPGGSVEALYYMLCLLTPKADETMFSLIYAHNEREDYPSYNFEYWQPETLVVLVNEYSASASEVFAGSLQDRGLATIVGATTYGKARAQAHIPLSGGDYLVLTISTIELPKTGDYQDVGIVPNHIVELAIEQFTLPELTPLVPSRALFSMADGTARVLALEERLSLLGYFRGEPDMIFDAYTLFALQCFQLCNDLKTTSYATAATLTLIQTQVEALEELSYLVDTQFEKAMEICKS